ncbi:FkbM family methyltransferase [Stutzerimonas xanthomarina]|uniref:FkbM family methyltransferase n=1 Tax=Stutzerimonas xanthomarina TaxID=271420 RepID=UPI0029AAD218|nr:FkbM family methyltransferase [Stutzerimonas xanthomarina]MDX2352682.1 FkbM family methyltransferase [Stutzerimonas xanthomarina]
MSFISYAQNFEDVMLWRALKHVENGFYIDIGAQHPVVDSVSLAFYEHGWRGVHVEPTQQYSILLRAARPDESVLQVAIGNQNQKVTFFEFEDTGLSTVDADVAHQHRASGFKCREMIVPVLSLEALLQQVGAQDIHWLKVDVEGLEPEVLESWQSCANLPWVVIVESTRPLTQEPSHQAWEPLLLAKGYSYVYFDGLNRFYVSPAHPELAEAFNSPPNIFDGFFLSGTASQPFCSLVSSRAQQAEASAEVTTDRAQQAEAKALQAELRVVHAEAKAQQAELRAEQAEAETHQADGRMQQAEAYAQQVGADLSAIHKSRSWRVTRPLRWFSFQVQLLRLYGFKGRIKAAIRKLASLVLPKATGFFNARPRLRRHLVSLAKRTGTFSVAKRLYYGLLRVGGGNHPQGVSDEKQSLPLSLMQLTPRARRLYAAIKTANENKKRAV